MIDKQLEMMASKAANYVPVSKRDKAPPQVRGVEIGAEKTAVAAPGAPAVEKTKSYVKPFGSGPGMGKGNPTSPDAMKRAMGRM